MASISDYVPTSYGQPKATDNAFPTNQWMKSIFPLVRLNGYIWMHISHNPNESHDIVTPYGKNINFNWDVDFSKSSFSNKMPLVDPATDPKVNKFYMTPQWMIGMKKYSNDKLPYPGFFNMKTFENSSNFPNTDIEWNNRSPLNITEKFNFSNQKRKFTLKPIRFTGEILTNPLPQFLQISGTNNIIHIDMTQPFRLPSFWSYGDGGGVEYASVIHIGGGGGNLVYIHVKGNHQFSYRMSGWDRRYSFVHVTGNNNIVHVFMEDQSRVDLNIRADRIQNNISAPFSTPSSTNNRFFIENGRIDSPFGNWGSDSANGVFHLTGHLTGARRIIDH